MKERVTVAIRHDLKEYVEQLASIRGVSITAMLDEIVETYLSMLTKDDINPLEKFAKWFIRSMFSPSDAALFLELCEKQYKVPAHIMMAGILLLAKEQGQWTGFVVDPNWYKGETYKDTEVCGTCKKQFTPTRIGQRYCSNECGLKALGSK